MNQIEHASRFKSFLSAHDMRLELQAICRPSQACRCFAGDCQRRNQGAEFQKGLSSFPSTFKKKNAKKINQNIQHLHFCSFFSNLFPKKRGQQKWAQEQGAPRNLGWRRPCFGEAPLARFREKQVGRIRAAVVFTSRWPQKRHDTKRCWESCCGDFMLGYFFWILMWTWTRILVFFCWILVSFDVFRGWVGREVSLGDDNQFWQPMVQFWRFGVDETAC